MSSTVSTEADRPRNARTAAPMGVRPPGPGAALWYAAGDQRIMLFAIRGLLHQVAHPMVGAGVAEHSVYKTDPYGRLWRTTQSVNRQVYGGARTAEEGRRLVQMHAAIRGSDAEGRRYSALDPEAYLWVHATMYETWRTFLVEVGPGLDEAQEEQLFDEWRRVGLLIGCAPRLMPATRAEFWTWWEQMLTRLENNPVVQDLFYAVPRKPHLLPVPQRLLDAAARPLLARQRDIIACTIDPGLRQRVGLPAPTERTRRRVRRTFAAYRLGNRLPDRLRLVLTSQLAIRATRRDGTLPEPVPYPHRTRPSI